MLTFSYKAVNAEGEVVEGRIHAADRRGAIEALRDRALIPLSADRDEPTRSRPWSITLRRRRRVTDDDLALLTRTLATLLRASLPLDRALSVARNVVQSDVGRALVDEVLEAVRGGASLAEALQARPDVFPSFYLGMVRAGERSGALGPAMGDLAKALERTQAIRAKVASALTYPVIVLLMALVSIVILVGVVVPEFRPLFEEAGADLPLSTKALVWTSDLLTKFGWLLALAALAAWGLLRRLTRDPAVGRRIDGRLLQVPQLGSLLVSLDLSRFARVLGSLLRGGVDVVGALEMARGAMRNAALASMMAALRPQVTRGERLGTALASRSEVPDLFVQLVRAGEESGKLGEMLLQLADIYDEESSHRMERALALLVPAATVLLGAFVGLVIASIFSAILSSHNLPL